MQKIEINKNTTTGKPPRVKKLVAITSRFNA
jgi:hypothetical protein